MNTILFDLDGTLLNMNTEYFIDKYYKLLARDFAYLGDSEKFIKAFNVGYFDMVKNQTDKSNLEVFEESFKNTYPEYNLDFYNRIVKFYETSFNEIAEGFCDGGLAQELVKILKDKGYKLVIATNPVFPRNATLSRLSWIGVDHEDFEMITTFEDFSRCKPSKEYYQDILDKLNLTSENCLMVGNDVKEDLAIRALGVKTYLVTDNILNRENIEFTKDYQGSFEELIEFAKKLPKVEE